MKHGSLWEFLALLVQELQKVFQRHSQFIRLATQILQIDINERILCTLRINGRNLEQCFPISSRQTGTRSTQVLKGGIGVRVVKWWKAGMQIMCISWQIAKKSWYEASTRKGVMWVLNLVLLGWLGFCRLRFGAWAHQWCSSALFVMAGVPKCFESRPLTVSTGVIFESFEVCLVSRFCGALTEMEFWS